MNQQTMSRIKQESCFGQLEPAYRGKISVYCKTEGKHIADFYACDLNEVIKRHHAQAFMYGERYKIVSSCGYVEYIR